MKNYTIKKAYTKEEIIEMLEKDEELRKKFFNVVIGHTIHQTEVISINPPKSYSSIVYSGLNEESDDALVPNEDYWFLLNLLWEVDYERFF